VFSYTIRGMGLSILGDPCLIMWLIKLGNIITMPISGSGGQGNDRGETMKDCPEVTSTPASTFCNSTYVSEVRILQ
jgi:hypothetical protein